MRSVVDIPAELRPVQALLGGSLKRVEAAFDRELVSDLQPVNQLCAYIERYRGKMLRPTMVLLWGLASSPDAAKAFAGGREKSLLNDAHITVGAVVEMVHMATLVHDDVLDEADLRRRGETINSLHGNESAVILGDELIASAFRLCSTLDTQHASLTVGRASKTTCEGELLQLAHRNDWMLTEATYYTILERKTAALIAASCSLGAHLSGAGDKQTAAGERFGRQLGVAFQIQDDLLDLTGDRQTVGKSVGKDLEKGKLTLPWIHHLSAAPAGVRTRSVELIEQVGRERLGRAPAELLDALNQTGSIGYTRKCAGERVEQARGELANLPDTPARAMLDMMAHAVVQRAF